MKPIVSSFFIVIQSGLCQYCEMGMQQFKWKALYFVAISLSGYNCAEFYFII